MLLTILHYRIIGVLHLQFWQGSKDEYKKIQLPVQYSKDVVNVA